MSIVGDNVSTPGLFSKPGDIVSTLGACHDECGDIVSTLGDVQYTGGIHEYTGGFVHKVKNHNCGNLLSFSLMK